MKIAAGPERKPVAHAALHFVAALANQFRIKPVFGI
jgi:hypothetical protein